MFEKKKKKKKNFMNTISKIGLTTKMVQLQRQHETRQTENFFRGSSLSLLYDPISMQ